MFAGYKQSLAQLNRIGQQLDEWLKSKGYELDFSSNAPIIQAWMLQHYYDPETKLSDGSLENFRKCIAALKEKNLLKFQSVPKKNADWNTTNERSEAIAKALQFESMQSKADKDFCDSIIVNCLRIIDEAPGNSHSARLRAKEELKKKLDALRKVHDIETPAGARKVHDNFLEFVKNFEAKEYMRARPV